MKGRRLAVFAIAFSVILVLASMGAGAYTGSALVVGSIHTTDADFNNPQTLDGMAVSGSGESAVIEYAGIKEIDSVEDNDISEYGGETADFEAQSTIVHDGSYAIKGSTTQSGDVPIESTSGLPNYPDQGETFSQWVRVDGDDTVGISWAIQSENSDTDNQYGAWITPGATKGISLAKWSSGSYTALDDTSVSVSTSTWYKLEVNWQTDGSIQVTLYDNSESQVATLSATDTEFTDGGYGVFINDRDGGGATGYFDTGKITTSNTGNYVSANHAVENSEQGFVDITTIQDVEATVTWKTDGGATLSQATYTTTGNKSQSWSVSSATDVYVDVSVEKTGTNPQFELADEGVQFTNHAPDAANLAPADNAITNYENVDLSADISDQEFPLAQGDSVDVKWYVDGSHVHTDTVTSDSSLTYTTSALADGDHTWHIELADSYGGTFTSSTRTVTVDHYAPEADNASASPTGGTSFNDENVETSIDISDRDFGIDGDSVTVDLIVDGTQTNTTTISSNQTVSLVAPDMGDGSHSWYVELTDNYGNTGTSDTFTFEVNHYAPVLDNTSASPQGNPTTHYEDETLSIDLSDTDFAESSGDTVTLDWYVDGSLEATTSSSTNGTVSATVGPFADGSHSWHVVATDEYGNTTTSNTFSWTIDHYAPSFDDGSASPTGDLTSKEITLQIDATDRDFDIDGDSVTGTFYVKPPTASSYSSVGTAEITANGTLSETYTASEGGSYEWYVVADDDYGYSDTSNTFSFNSPDELKIYNESNPTQLIDNATVNITFYPQEDDPTIVTRSTTNGTINMTGLPVDVPLVASANAENFTKRRIFIPSLYDQQRLYLLPDSEPTDTTIFSIEDYTGGFPSEHTALFVKRGLNGSYQSVMGDYFGATGQFPGELAHNERHRLYIVNTETGEQRDIGSFTPVTDTTQTIVVTPEGVERIEGRPPQITVKPQSRQLPAKNGTELFVSVAEGNQTVDSWSVTATLAGDTNTTVWTYSQSGEGSASKTLNLTGESNRTLNVSITYTVNGTSSTEYYDIQIVEDFATGNTLMDLIGQLAQLSPEGQARDAFTTFLAMLITIFAVAGVASAQPSGEIAGAAGVFVLGGLSAIGWVSYDLVFVSAVGLVSFAAIRRGL